MIINGRYVPNITCPKCGFRHPESERCVDMEAVAKIARLERELLTLREENDGLQLKIEALESDIMEAVEYRDQ